MRKRWAAVQDFFDIKGGAILGLFSLEVLAVIAYYACVGKELPSTVRDVYGIVVGAFAATNVAKYYGQRRNNDEKSS